MLRLMPPVCRDCGKSEREVELSAYLDFQLCAPCIGRRERELLASDRPRRVTASAQRPDVAPESRDAGTQSPSKKPVKKQASGKARAPAKRGKRRPPP